jgi:peptidoglycan/xylan/chitin deacetylase (PgdA/CDA1 family)
VAITFDAGAGAAPTAAMLDVLRAAGVRSTFFLTGKWSQENPALVKRIYANGHELANHSWNHPDFRQLSDAAIVEEIASTEGIIGDLTGADTKPWFRFPYGARDARTRAVVASLGYASVFWTLDSLDSVGAVKTPQFLYERITTNAVNGSIILVHVGSAPTAAALPDILKTLQERGLRPVTISQLVG